MNVWGENVKKVRECGDFLRKHLHTEHFAIYVQYAVDGDSKKLRIII